MWDEGEKRGWLVNGTSALLHLVRARFENIRSGNFGSLFDFNLCDITEAANQYHPRKSAAEVLKHPANLELVVGQGRTERYTEQKTTGERQESTETLKKSGMTFEAFVEHFMSYLEQIMDHQIRLAGQGGVKLKAHVRKQLEGWDFRNVLTSSHPTPSVTKLDSLGWGWVDFVRSINAVTLFGRGFGDLITAAEPKLLCPDWQILPKGKYYLAASAVDLKAAMKIHGNRYSSPPQLVHGLAWHSPISCSCAGAKGFGKKHCDPVQVLLPTASKHILTMEGPLTLDQPGTAAFVLGHNFSRPLRWFDGSSIPEVVQETEDSSERDPQHTSEYSPEVATILVEEQRVYSQGTETSSFTDHGIGSSSVPLNVTPESSVEVPPSSERSERSKRISPKTNPGHPSVEPTESPRASIMKSETMTADSHQPNMQVPVLSSSRSRRRRMLNFINRRGANRQSTDPVADELRSAQAQAPTPGDSRNWRLWRWPRRAK
jgi:hypothetical protein